MTVQQEARLKKMGIFTLGQASEAGLNQSAISRLVKQNRLTRLHRGFYSHPEASVDLRILDFQIAYKKFGPKAVIGVTSALFYYNLIDEQPRQIWVLVPTNRQTYQHRYRLIRTGANLKKQIVTEENFKITTLERTILDSLRLISKIGERTALAAARTALHKGLTTEGKLGKAATELGYNFILAKHIEAIVA